MMKIALIILHADPARGGAERYTVDLATALAGRGHQVSLLASTFGAPIERVKFVAVEAKGATRAGQYRSFLNRLDAHLLGETYEIVHAMLPVRKCDVYHPHAGIAAEAMSKKSVWFNPRRWMMASVEKELLMGERGPVVLCLSEYIKGFVRKHYPLPEDRLATLFNAVDLERFQPQARPVRDEINALFIGNDFVRKGLTQAASAVSLLKDERVKLTIVGKRKWRTHLPFPFIHFAGLTMDTRAFYADADFFVLPTKHDPCSLVVLEALAMGVPVISTKFNGACEIMREGVHGFVLEDPDDVEALAEAMRKMLDPHRREAMSKACLELRGALSYEHHLDRLEEIYAEVMRFADKPSPQPSPEIAGGALDQNAKLRAE
jgi:UDP-glucose:(heptosyl)LPS alpha-1,3-glucosyltransferase